MDKSITAASDPPALSPEMEADIERHLRQANIPAAGIAVVTATDTYLKVLGVKREGGNDCVTVDSAFDIGQSGD